MDELMTGKNLDRYMYVHRVAEILNCSEKLVYALIKDGDLEAIRIGQRAIRVAESSLCRFIEARKVDPEEYFEDVERKQKPVKTKVVKSNWMSSQ